MKELVENIAKALVDHPEAVQVKAVEGTEVTVLQLRTHPHDLGKVIGREGRIVNAVRTLLGAIGMKLHKRFVVEIVEERIATNAVKQNLLEHADRIN
ncbi:MAG TPA: KH domain-containing protein [Candidatus Sulfotelmatobacter sp.]|nr:KH domain-containing protein [Candidatus Sulfotelmatobacter sp.]